MEFFNIGGTELFVIVLVTLVVFGPGRLPELMRDAGRLWRKVKTYSDAMRAEFNKAMNELELENPPPPDSETVQHPEGYDPATHSLPYVPPVFPEAIEVESAPPIRPRSNGVIEVIPEESTASDTSVEEASTPR